MAVKTANPVSTPDLLQALIQAVTQVLSPYIDEAVERKLQETQAADSLLDADQVADILGLKKQTVWQMRRRGVLSYVETAPGRFMFRRSDIDRYVDEHTTRNKTAREKAREAISR
ncbi:MAG: helix-turn-helix domain-containing protein [bacterium]